MFSVFYLFWQYLRDVSSPRQSRYMYPTFVRPREYSLWKTFDICLAGDKVSRSISKMKCKSLALLGFFYRRTASISHSRLSLANSQRMRNLLRYSISCRETVSSAFVQRWKWKTPVLTQSCLFAACNLCRSLKLTWYFLLTEQKFQERIKWHQIWFYSW